MVPWKLIIFLILLTIFVVFAGLNIKNVSDISIGFATIEDVPIFMSLFVAFLAGAFFMLPFTFRGRKQAKKPDPVKSVRKKKEPEQYHPEPAQSENPLHLQNDFTEDDIPSDIDKDDKG